MDRTGCVHHWMLSAPAGESVRGRCKRCGARREFPASLEGTSRQGIYDEAASMSRTVRLLPDPGGGGLPGRSGAW